jgi:diaminohydroxyphosphoribosylaminopyrimidine deaminase / 5-amino-6-(5-phosphoribosylamino)uracil reductase
MEAERKYMKRAISLARKGKGWVNPNPLVGAVLVKNGRIIGEGFHEYFGGPHAEVKAISDAKDGAEGSVLYVTLEPCSHHGKTPPCTDLIIKSRIREVFIGMPDPNPLVNGKGIQLLTENGIKVSSGVCESEIRTMNESFIKFITSGKPFCVLKTAMTLDGKIATVSGESRWISGERSRAFTHEMRQQYSAIMAGINTIEKDDPLLNTRRRGKKKDPLKVIIDSSARISLESQVLANEPQLTLVAVTSKADKTKLKEIERLGAQVLVCPSKGEKVDLDYLMGSLGTMGIDSLLLEGGSTLAFSALNAGIVDKVVSFISPKIVGGSLAPTPVGGEGIAKLKNAIPLHDISFRRMGGDIMIQGYVNKNP